MVHGGYVPGWPPFHEWGARAAASALAAELGMPVVDASVPQVLSADKALKVLPDDSREIRLADWLRVFQSSGSRGVWARTKGLGRFRLPELQVHNVPPQLAQPLVSALTGLASRLLGLWLSGVGEQPDRNPAFVELPAEIDIGMSDVAIAYGGKSQGDRS